MNRIFILVQTAILLLPTVIAFPSAVQAADDSVIRSVAGNGLMGYSGDGGEAVRAQLAAPAGICGDRDGNLYIADTYNHRIRKVDINGTISTIAGTGNMGSSGDGGPATAARLSRPSGIAIDAAGNLYIADTFNHRIRKVDSSGQIGTVAGNGTFGYSGDGGPATVARFSYPSGVAVDGAGNLYIADTYNHRIRKVDPSGTVQTVVGNGTGGYSGDGGPATSAKLAQPFSVFVDGAGNLYIDDRFFHNIRKVDTNGIIQTIAGNGIRGSAGDGGLALNASFSSPHSVFVDTLGNIFVADSGGHRVRRIDVDGIVTAVAGNGVNGYSGDNGPALSAKMTYPISIYVDDAN